MKKVREVRRIDIKAGEPSAKPIRLSFSDPETYVEIRIGKGATATIFDTSSSKTHSVGITLEPQSSLLYVSVSSSSAKKFQSTVASGASIHWHCTTIGGRNDAHELISRLTGPDAKSTVDWIFFAKGKERQSVSVRNIFAAPEGRGEVTIKGVAQDHSKSSCYGMIEITEQGRGTNTYLTEDVLMLDPTAQIDAVPALEIRTNDVKASHSATISRVTSEDLFYLQSRGLQVDMAKQMFVDGFLLAIVERIPDASIREAVCSALRLKSAPE